MAALTTRQRDLLKALLDADAPMGTEELATKMRLTPRQVNYGLKGAKSWLLQRGIELQVTPGVGIVLDCSQEQSEKLRQSLSSPRHIQIILSAGQRQQLFALVLLVAEGPLFLSELEQLAQVSRSTVSKDLDAVDTWVGQRGLPLIRRPNFGIWPEEGENIRQELIAALLWGKTPFGESLTHVTHNQGLIFSLHQDAGLLPLLQRCDEIIRQWNMERVFAQVAYAEAQLGGRFTDDAVLHLALVFAIQANRISHGYHFEVDTENLKWLKTLPVWPVAKMVAKRLGWCLLSEKKETDIAGIAMHILAAPRNERWPGDLDLDEGFRDLMGELMAYIAEYYDTPEIDQDRTLHDGIVNHIIPACMRQRFNLWQPSPSPTTTLSVDKYASEHKVAQSLVEIIEKRTAIRLPETEINNIAALLRAARIRIRPYLFRQVIVVCPSGMATAQLLVARLEARFPRLGPLNVISLRELGDENTVQAELIITTVPLAEEITQRIDVIQVHPLLLPEDVAAITQYLT
jgi:mannitol operon transcriptional antiterminator